MKKILLPETKIYGYYVLWGLLWGQVLQYNKLPKEPSP